VLVAGVPGLSERVQEVALVPDERAVQELVPARLHQRSIIEFMRGIWTPLSTVSIPASVSTVSNRPGNSPSRGRAEGPDPPGGVPGDRQHVQAAPG
jgi:hypothetical protein